MQAVVTAEQVVTYWNDIMKRAGSREERDSKREREYYRAVMLLNPKIKSCHNFTPRHLVTLPWLRRI